MTDKSPDTVDSAVFWFLAEGRSVLDEAMGYVSIGDKRVVLLAEIIGSLDRLIAEFDNDNE